MALISPLWRCCLVDLVVEHSNNWHQVRLLVDLQFCPLVGALQMNAEAGNSHERFLYVHELALEPTARLADNDAAR